LLFSIVKHISNEKCFVFHYVFLASSFLANKIAGWRSFAATWNHSTRLELSFPKKMNNKKRNVKVFRNGRLASTFRPNPPSQKRIHGMTPERFNLSFQ
jgi:hypothetical protein